MQNNNEIINNSQKAFEYAISKGILTTNVKDHNYAGRYMYMGPSVKVNHIAFKHSDTREYLHCELTTNI